MFLEDPAGIRRGSPKVTKVLPILYLRGLSTGDVRPALEDPLGEKASGLSPSTISRLYQEWEAHHARFAPPRGRVASQRFRGK